MEQANALLNESDAELLSGFEDGRVILATTRSSNVLGSRSASSVDIIDEGELVLLIELQERMLSDLRMHRWKRQPR